MRRATSFSVGLLIAIGFAVAPVAATQRQNFETVKPNPDYLEKTLQQHKRWLDSHDKEKEEERGRADLSWTNLRLADLHGADLRRAILHGADLHGADLHGADLRLADLHEAILRRAILRNADLRGADLRDTLFDWPDMLETDLRGAKGWSGVFANKKVLSLEDFRVILHDHNEWTGHKKGTRAHLRGADLRGANLSRVNLRKADLRGAVLSGVNLHEATLSWADLTDADLIGARLINADLSNAKLSNAHLLNASLHFSHLSEAFLNGADLREANLSEADLRGANLSGAILSEAILSEADLSMADLSGADLQGAILCEVDLADADFFGADVSHVLYDPKPKKLPETYRVAYAKHIGEMDYARTPYGLIELRQAFKESGLRKQERELTYAIKHAERLRSSFLESTLLWAMFEFPCKYGLDPFRPLYLFLIIMASFSILYIVTLKINAVLSFMRKFLVIRIFLSVLDIVARKINAVLSFMRRLFRLSESHPTRVSGKLGEIWIVWPKRPIQENGGENVSALVSRKWPEVIGVGLYFSLQSAFHMGWRDFNVGNWIARIQREEYGLKATGWIRTLSGIQSLISLYLLALFLLTYFERLFDNL